MLLQIHDELVFESPVKDQKDNEKLIKKVMTSVSSSEHHMFSDCLMNVNSGYNNLGGSALMNIKYLKITKLRKQERQFGN